MPQKILLFILVLSLFVGGAAFASMYIKTEENTDQQIVNPPTTTINIEPTAKYKIELVGKWENAPRAGNFTNIYLYSGDSLSETFLIVPGLTASDNIKEYIKSENTENIDNLLKSLQTKNNIYHYTKALQSSPTDTYEFALEFTSKHSYLSFISQIIPSPDWLLSAPSINLIEKGKWVETKEIYTYVLDAGIFDGDDFDSSTKLTDPQSIVTFLPQDDINIATIKITKID